MGSKRGPKFIFWGRAPIYINITKYVIQKNMGIKLKKKKIRVPNFFLARAPKFLNPALTVNYTVDGSSFTQGEWWREIGREVPAQG